MTETGQGLARHSWVVNCFSSHLRLLAKQDFPYDLFWKAVTSGLDIFMTSSPTHKMNITDGVNLRLCFSPTDPYTVWRFMGGWRNNSPCLHYKMALQAVLVTAHSMVSVIKDCLNVDSFVSWLLRPLNELRNYLKVEPLSHQINQPSWPRFRTQTASRSHRDYKFCTVSLSWYCALNFTHIKRQIEIKNKNRTRRVSGRKQPSRSWTPWVAIM